MKTRILQSKSIDTTIQHSLMMNDQQERQRSLGLIYDVFQIRHRTFGSRKGRMCYKKNITSQKQMCLKYELTMCEVSFYVRFFSSKHLIAFI